MDPKNFEIFEFFHPNSKFEVRNLEQLPRSAGVFGLMTGTRVYFN
jgi:hypothetical protein